jgi:hypothetical protein
VSNKHIFRALIAAALLMTTAIAQATAYSGLAISRVWARDGYIVVQFDCTQSLDFNACAACPAAYTTSADYKGILAVLLAAQGQGKHVSVYDAAGGTTLQALVDSSVPATWSRPISLVAIEPN